MKPAYALRLALGLLIFASGFYFIRGLGSYFGYPRFPTDLDNTTHTYPLQ